MRRIMQRAPFRSAFAALALAAIRDALDRRHDGGTFTWINPPTKATGTIRVLAWNLCRTPQGWKFAEGR